jgi:hypothetical protein
MKPTPDPEITNRILGAFQNTPVMNIEQVAKSAKTTTITATKHLSRLAKKARSGNIPVEEIAYLLQPRGQLYERGLSKKERRCTGPLSYQHQGPGTPVQSS